MNFKTLVSVGILTVAGLFASPAVAQYGGTNIGVGFGGSYSRTKIDTPQGTVRVSNSQIGGGIGINSVSGYGYGGYGYGGYGYGYGGYGVPVYSPFTRCYGNPYYPPVVLPYYGGPVVPVYPICNGQFIVR